MSLDSFVDQYVKLLNQELTESRAKLEATNFKKKADFTRVQGQIQGLNKALEMLRAIPEDD